MRVEVEPTVETAGVRRAPTAEPRGVPTTSTAGLAYKRRAEQAFLAGKYNEALRHANHALVEMPRDGVLYLFTGQALFAVGDYRAAAAAIHQAVSLLDSKDWGRVVEDYRRYYRGRAFVDQMDRLNDYIEKNSDAAYARFVRGYQYGFLGHEKTAIRDLTKTLELESRDELAARLLVRFGGTVPERAPRAIPAEGPADDGGGHRDDGHGHDGHDDSSDDAGAEMPPAPKTSVASPPPAGGEASVAVDSPRRKHAGNGHKH